MGSNTVGKIQKYAVVPIAMPNVGSPSVEDATDADIKASYEANANTNAFSDADVSKLASIADGAQVNPTNTDGLAEGATNKYMTTEAKRLGVTQTLNASATTTFDPKVGRVTIFNMDASIVGLLASDGAFDGQIAILIFKQDGVGSRTCSYSATNFEGGLDVGVPVLFGTANTRSYVVIAWNDTTTKWDFVSFVRRYP